MAGERRLLIGTGKGAFILTQNGDAWDVSGPHCEGWPINHVVGDPKSGAIYAAGGGEWFGAGVWRSTDGGQTWKLSKFSNGQMDEWLRNDPEFAKNFGLEASPPAPFTGEVDEIWSLAVAPDGAVYAGAKPGKLYKSTDGGETWQGVAGMNNHPDRESWQPGAVGLTLHSLIIDQDDPSRLWAGISAAGVFASEDGGQTWEMRNRRSNADTAKHVPHPAAGHDGAIGSCVHNLVRAGGDRLYQQNHHGVFRSDDGGRSWLEITEGLPSHFGFPIAVHPHNPDEVFVIPLNGDMQGRFVVDASAAVYRTKDAGATWEKTQNGLPTKNAYFTTLRQSMATDRRDPAGVYFGTNTGSVFATFDEGENWLEVAQHLPIVRSVETI